MRDNADYRLPENRYAGFIAYHVAGMRMDEVDPAKPALRYIAKALNLTLEQRFWLAWLYGSCYCVATAFYMLTRFPTLESMTDKALDEFWRHGQNELLFTTDRHWVKANDLFPEMVKSYKQFCRHGQVERFGELLTSNAHDSYLRVYETVAKELYYFSRFSIFTYLEALYNVTNIPMLPNGLDLRNALSSRNGLCFMLGKDAWVSGRHKPRVINDRQLEWLQAKLAELYAILLRDHPEIPTTYWNLETSLCAYKKLFFCTRYVGYYIDRQMVEIRKMQSVAPKAADWDLLWQFRREHFHPGVLGEIGGWGGIRHEKLHHFMDTGELGDDMPSYTYRRKAVTAWS